MNTNHLISNAYVALSLTQQETRIRNTLAIASEKNALSSTAIPVDNIALVADGDYIKTCISEIGAAKDSIVISMGLIAVTKWKSHPTYQLLDALISADNRNVQIDVYTSINGNSSASNNLVAKRLHDSKITVNMLDSTRPCHHKAIVIDDRITIIGSHNWTAPSLIRRNEISIVVQSASFASRVIQAIAMTHS